MRKARKYLAWCIIISIIIGLIAVLNVSAAEPLTAGLVHDAAGKCLTVTFSQETEASDFSETALFRVNNAENVALRTDSVSESEVRFLYKEELKQAEEYVLILPKGIKSKSGAVLNQRYYRFTTDDDFDSVQILQSCDYSGGASIYTDIESYSPSTNGPNYFEDGEHGAAWGIKLKESAVDYNIPLNGLNALSDNLTALSFSMKPLEDLKLDISFMTYNDKTPVNIGFYNSYGIRVGRAWQFAQNTEKLCDYTPNRWYKVKLIYDKIQNRMWIYINGVMLKELDSEYLADYTGIRAVRFMVPKDECDSARTVLVLDDIKTETVKKDIKVSNVRFIDSAGDEEGGLAVGCNGLTKSDISFSRAVKGESLTPESVKLLYDGEPIEYNGVLSEDKKVYTVTPSNPNLKYEKASIAVSGVTDESGNACADYNTFVVSNDYKGGMTAALVSVDEELHRIKLRLSEPMTDSMLERAALISARTGNRQSVEVESNNGSEVVLTYTNTLDGSTEYALEFAKGTKGIFNGMITDRWLHFSTNKTNWHNSRESGTWSNYEDNAARVYTNFYGAVDIDHISKPTCNRNKNLIDTGDDGYGKAWKVDVVTDSSNSSGQWLGNNNLWWKGLKAPTADISALRFSVKPVKWQNTLIEFYDKSGKQFGIALRPFYNGLGALRYGKTMYAGSANDGLLHLDGNGELWKYKANEWIDFKVVRDKINNTMDIWVNEEHSAHLDSAYFAGYTGFADKTETAGDWFMRIMTQPGQIAGTLGEALLYIDNIYTYSITETSGVVESKYYGDNDVYNCFEETKEDIERISVKFSEPIDESSVTSDTVKIVSGESGENVEWTKTYNAEENMLTLNLAKPLAAKIKNNVTISGVLAADKTKTIGDYIAYAGEDAEQVTSLGITDENGTEVSEFNAGETYYVNFYGYNNSEVPKNITFIIAQYDDSLESVEPTTGVSINPKSALRVTADSENKISITPKSGTKTIRVFAWNNTAQMTPLCPSASVTKAE